MSFDSDRSRDDESERDTADRDRSSRESSENTSRRSVSNSSPGPTVDGRVTMEDVEEYYDREVESAREYRYLERLEERHGERFHQWIEDGVPTAAMNSESDIEAYRERKGTPVPWDIESYNDRSERRNTGKRARKRRRGPDGETRVPEVVREVISSRGRSLDSSVQETVEARMGESFEDVQIHTGPRAAEATEAINARAFTVGNHIAFNHGEYDPESPEGQHVLIHELAHVRQQTGGALSMLPQEDVVLEIDPDPELEREAEEAAERVMDGDKSGIQRLRQVDVHIQRTEQSELSDFFEGVPEKPVLIETDNSDKNLNKIERISLPESLPEHPVKNRSAEFGTASNISGDKPHRDNFFEEFEELENAGISLWVHHAVEKQARDKFPGIISDEEIHSVENLRGIPELINSELHLSMIRQEWDRFYRKNDYNVERTDTTPDEVIENADKIRQNLLNKATQIDDKYGQHFLPPTRGDSSSD